MMERLGNSNAKAVREEIEKFDAARARAMRALFSLGEEDSRLYHLVLNTERLALDACVKGVCELAEGLRFGDRVSARSALADKLLEAKISSALMEKISVSAPLGVSVSVVDGKITLAGTTTSGGLRAEAESIAYAVAEGQTSKTALSAYQAAVGSIEWLTDLSLRISHSVRRHHDPAFADQSAGDLSMVSLIRRRDFIAGVRAAAWSLRRATTDDPGLGLPETRFADLDHLRAL